MRRQVRVGVAIAPERLGALAAAIRDHGARDLRVGADLEGRRVDVRVGEERVGLGELPRSTNGRVPGAHASRCGSSPLASSAARRSQRSPASPTRPIAKSREACRITATTSTSCRSAAPPRRGSAGSAATPAASPSTASGIISPKGASGCWAVECHMIRALRIDHGRVQDA